MTIKYTDLRNQEGTIINKNTGFRYGENQTPEQSHAQLATDLGIAPDQINWQAIANEPVGTSSTPAAPKFEVKTDPIIDSSILAEAYANPATVPDNAPTAIDEIKGKYEELSQNYTDLEGQFAEASKPTQQETDLETELADLRKSAEMDRIATQRDVSGLEKGSQTTSHIGGRIQNVEREEQFRRQTMAAQESNLLSRLGIEQNKRTGLLEGLKTKLGFAENKQKLYSEMYDKIQAEQDKIIARADKLSDNARLTLATILEKFKGIDLESMKPEDQAVLAKLAGQAGIPLSILQAGMKSQKDQQEFDNLMEKQKNTPKEVEKWSEPYNLGGDIVQKNEKTGEIRTAVNVPKGTGEGRGTSDVEQYAQDVFDKKLTLTSVPVGIRAKVNQRVNELNKENPKYESDFEARIDYNSDLNKLVQARNDGDLTANPIELINILFEDYGGFISKEEIKNAIYDLLYIKAPEKTVEEPKKGSFQFLTGNNESFVK